MNTSLKQIANVLLFSLSMALIISAAFECTPLVPFVALLLFSFIPKPQKATYMALQVEIWEKDIVDNLFKNNEFALRAFNADPYVIAGKVVHIPVAGASAVIKKNLTNFPQVAVNRTDSDITYAIDNYFALPRQIQDWEKYENSYDKRQSVAGEDQRKLVEEAMNGLLYRWAPGSAANAGMAKNIVLTDGADTGEDLIDDTATGTRKMFTKAAFKKASKAFAKTDVNGRKTALLTAAHYHQFFESLSDSEKTNFNNVANLAEGTIGRYMGIDVIMRSSVLRYRGANLGALVPVDEQDDAYAPSANDRAASLFYVDSAVERARGEVKMFDNQGQALYYGDVFSAYLRLGGRIRRRVGVLAVVEEIGA